jgi:hypothetical protein
LLGECKCCLGAGRPFLLPHPASVPRLLRLTIKPVIRPLCLRAKAVLFQEGRAKPSDDSGNRPSFAVSPQ